MNVERTHAYASEVVYKITVLVAELGILRAKNDIDDTMSHEVNEMLLRSLDKATRQQRLLERKLSPLNSRKGR